MVNATGICNGVNIIKEELARINPVITPHLPRCRTAAHKNPQAAYIPITAGSGARYNWDTIPSITPTPPPKVKPPVRLISIIR